MADVLLPAALALVLSYLGVGGLVQWATRRQILDVPNERSSHTRPTPRGGGLVIVLLSTGGLLLAWLLKPASFPPGLPGYLVGAWLVAGVSWLDDLRSLPNRVRFTAHLVAAIVAMWAWGYWSRITLPGAGDVRLGWVGLPITLLWIVWLTNAYNFMDGIDGIAGGQAVVAGIGWAALGWMTGQPLAGLLGLLLAASSLGFLGHNWAPARIFMGDVGSAFLGYTFAVLPVVAAQTNPRLAAAGVLLVWPFIFDTTFTLLRRLRMKENVFAAHRSHLYQRLVIAGHTHRSISFLYIGAGLVGVLLALAWVQASPGSAVAILLGLPLMGLGLWGYTICSERRCTC